MVIIEGIRRSGKTFVSEVIRKNFINVTVHKDEWMKHIYKNVDIDDFVIGRDITYAQIIPKIKNNIFVFDRQYISSYVYGQFYRKKYNKSFWKEHINKVEEIYGDYIRNITIVFITLNEEDFKKVSAINRNKDKLETDNINDYIKQYELYFEAINNITKANIINLKYFSDEKTIINIFNDILKV